MEPIKPNRYQAPEKKFEAASGSKKIDQKIQSAAHKAMSGSGFEGASLAARVSMPMFSIKIDGMNRASAQKYFDENAASKRLGPDLLLPGDDRLRDVNRIYPIRKNESSKADFRDMLVQKLRSAWTASLGQAQAQELIEEFEKYADIIQNDGVGAFGDLVSKETFEQLIASYSQILETEGNKTWLHSFVDFRNHPQFLLNTQFNGAFFHPLNIALIAHKMGGPIRVTDARGKDAAPISAVTLDNMLHIDNVPFTEEIKQTVFWRQGKALGPNGQCFVCLPGTHKTPRAFDGAIIDGAPILIKDMGSSRLEKLKQDPNPIVFTTEAGSVFRNEGELKGALNAQREVRGVDKPLVVALRDNTKVLTATAETGNLVHHRYRREEGDPRSCLLIAFHLIANDPGGLVTKENLDKAKREVKTDDLSVFLLDKHDSKDPQLMEKFLGALSSEAANIRDMLLSLKSSEKSSTGSPQFLSPESKALNEKEIAEWQESVLHGPGTEKIKRQQKIISLGEQMTQGELVSRVKQLMAYDKTGVLELILYSDGREEKRKWARNQIRELRLEKAGELTLENDPRPPSLDKRLETWTSQLNMPSVESLCSKEQLEAFAMQLYEIGKYQIQKGTETTSELKPKISKEVVLPAVSQLLHDLGVAIQNCTNREAFISTGLFIFWACDTLMRILPDSEDKSEIYTIGQKLLNHYVSVNILAEIQLNEADLLQELADDPFLD